MKRLVRFGITVGIIGLFYAILALFFKNSSQNMMKAIFPFSALCLVHCICYDLLECDSGFIRFIRAIIYYATVVFVTIISVKYSFAGIPLHASKYEIYEPIDHNSLITLCGSFPSVMLATIVTYASATDNKNRFMVWVSPLLALLGIIAGGLLVFFAAFIIGPWLAKVLIIVAIVVFVFILFTFVKEGSFVYSYSESSDSSSSSSGSKRGRSSSYSSSGDPVGDLRNHFSSIAMDNSRSIGVCFGVYISSWVEQSFYYYDSSKFGEVVFTVKFDIDESGLHAETENELRMVKNDLENFKRTIVNDIYNDANSIIGRVKNQNLGFGVVRVKVREE